MQPRGAKSRESRVPTPSAPERPEPEEPGVVMPTQISSREEVARRAYELYLERGGQDGHDVEDWLGAEAELLHDRGRAAS